MTPDRELAVEQPPQTGQGLATGASALAAALIDSLDAPALDRLAEILAPRLATRVAQHLMGPGPEAAWLDTVGAAKHLACGPSRIYELVDAERIPYHMEGTTLLFRPEELDQWVRAGGAKRS
jgi:excisionase family DNA binding protein